MKKQDRQSTEMAMKKGSDEHRIRGLQEQLDLKIRELLAVSGCMVVEVGGIGAYLCMYSHMSERLIARRRK
jgi:hypothetical protein